MDARDEGEEVAGEGFEPKHSRGTAALNEEHMIVVLHAPGASVGIGPAGFFFFDNCEDVGGVILDTETDGVGWCRIL